MTRQPNYAVLREEFNLQRKLRLDFPGGAALWLIDVSDTCGKPSVLVASEKGGVIRFEFDRPLNLFRLYTAGFPGGTASKVLDVLEAMFPHS